MRSPVLALSLAALSLLACNNQKTEECIFTQTDIVPTLLSARAVTESDAQPLTLLHFSDIHGSTGNLKRVVAFSQQYADYLADVIHTGDDVSCYMDDPDIFKLVPGAENILNTIGNHDCWKGHLLWAESDKPYDATKEDVYNIFFKGDDAQHTTVSNWNVIQPEGVDNPESADYCACYYYKDYPESKIRMFVLDCMHYDDAQDAWLASVLSEALADTLTVIGVTHYPAEKGVIGLECGFTPLGQDIAEEWNPDAIQFESMPDEAFCQVDSFIDACGTFVCWLSGHTHHDFIGFVGSHERQLQVIADKAGDFDEYMSEDRTPGSVNQDAFNLTTVNPGRGLLTILRVGCRRGPDMRSKRLFVYDYQQRTLITAE